MVDEKEKLVGKKDGIAGAFSRFFACFVQIEISLACSKEDSLPDAATMQYLLEFIGSLNTAPLDTLLESICHTTEDY